MKFICFVFYYFLSGACRDNNTTLDLDLADGGLLVVAGDVVPLDAVGVEVVEDAQAGLGVGVVAVLVPVVGLGPRGSSVVPSKEREQ